MKKFLALALILAASVARATNPTEVAATTSSCVAGTENAYPYGFKLFSSAHAKIVYTDTLGIETVLTPGQYAVSNVGQLAGGTVTIHTDICPKATGSVTISRDNIPLRQDTSFRTQGDYSAATHEKAFDYQSMVSQKLSRRIDNLDNMAALQTGPQGPQGIQGPQGAQGIQGIQGIQGPSGSWNGTVSANVDFLSTYKGVNVIEPTDAHDTATKNYVDNGSWVTITTDTILSATSATAFFTSPKTFPAGRMVYVYCLVQASHNSSTSQSMQAYISAASARTIVSEFNYWISTDSGASYTGGGGTPSVYFRYGSTDYQNGSALSWADTHPHHLFKITGVVVLNAASTIRLMMAVGGTTPTTTIKAYSGCVFN